MKECVCFIREQNLYNNFHNQGIREQMYTSPENRITIHLTGKRSNTVSIKKQICLHLQICYLNIIYK